MRWPIRSQILFPFVGIQILTLTVISAVFAWISVKEVERETLERFSRVLATLEDASFPLTQNVLDKLHLLSGAHFVAVDDLGNPMTATIPNPYPTLATVPSIAVAPSDHDFVDDYSLVQLGDERFFAGKVNPFNSPNAAAVVVLYPERRWKLARWNAVYPPLAIGVVALCFTLIASTLIARRMSHRIGSVQVQVARIAGGEFRPISIQNVNDELSDLARDINSMCVALETATRQMRETERANLIAQLASGLSHQLRNALTGARMALQLHSRRCPRRDDEALDVAQKQLRLTEEQIKALLRLTRGESQICRPANVDEILLETVSLVHPICNHNRISFETDIESIRGTVHDSDAIRGAVLNLIMNAIDAAGPEGRVCVTSFQDGSHVVVEVSDDGPGVSTEAASRIFEPFFTTKPEGIGLGLALVTKTASDFDGDLAMSRSDGLTTFRFTFRLSESEPIATRSHVDGLEPATTARVHP